jgi:hypothetical protein
MNRREMFKRLVGTVAAVAAAPAVAAAKPAPGRNAPRHPMDFVTITVDGHDVGVRGIRQEHVGSSVVIHLDGREIAKGMVKHLPGVLAMRGF